VKLERIFFLLGNDPFLKTPWSQGLNVAMVSIENGFFKNPW
jgi:hypothetical protein